MKIDLERVDKTNFMMHEHILNGEVLTLIQPVHIGTKWNNENLHFRSSLWNSNGELVSAGFKKFFNFGEKPDVSPVPTNINSCKYVQKLDGSLLCLSKYKGNFIFRTRGTVDATLMEKNGHEIDIFKSSILPKFDDRDKSDTWDYSIIFEWCSPLNRIVIFYPEVEFYLIGIVNHLDYSLKTQSELDDISKSLSLKRPTVYSFEDISSFEDILSNVNSWKGVEGIVVYSKNDQCLHKIKSLDYLTRHRLKSELSSFEKLVDFWVNVGKPDKYKTFFDEVSNLTDHETALEHQGNISRIIDAYKDVVDIKNGMMEFVEKLKSLPSRKEQAQKTTASYGITNRASFIFKMLDGKELSSDDEKKLLYQVLKK